MRFIASARYLALIGVACTLCASVVAFGWSALKVYLLAASLLLGESAGMATGLVHVVDAVLLGAGLLLSAFGLFELFVGHLDLPKALVVEDFDALKSKLAVIMALVMAVVFLERLEAGGDARDILYTGIAVTLVSGTLIAFGRLSK